METPETRRAAGALIEDARTALRISKRELARRARISETWYRALTTGLRGTDPQPASDEVWLTLAKLVGVGPRRLFATLGRTLPPGAERETAPPPSETRRHVLETGEEIIQLILEDVEAESDGLTEDEARRMTERALENARNQVAIHLKIERERIERERRKQAQPKK